LLGSRTASTSCDKTCVRCHSAAASITALAPNWPVLKARSLLRRCCAAYPTYSSTISSIPIGGRRLSCAALTSYRPVGNPIHPTWSAKPFLSSYAKKCSETRSNPLRGPLPDLRGERVPRPTYGDAPPPVPA